MRLIDVIRSLNKIIMDNWDRDIDYVEVKYKDGGRSVLTPVEAEESDNG